MSHDLVLKPVCSRCGSNTDLYGSNCKHITLCLTCGKTMAQNRAKCYECGAMLTRLIREYPVRASSTADKDYCIGRFAPGLPIFSKKKNDENKWSLQREGLVGRPQVTDMLREKYKKKPWILEDEAQKFQYHGHPEGAQSATYYLLMLQGKDFNAIPAGSWYDFKKVAQYDQFTLEEAEEMMKNRRKTADGYERWIMKAAKDGPAAFGEGGKFDEPEGLTGVKGRRSKKSEEEEDNASDKGGDDGDDGRRSKKSEEEEDNASDKGGDDGDDEFGRKNNLTKGGNDDEEEGHGGGDFDLDDEIEKGDDWEHEDTFTDDDEAVANDPDEREDLGLEVPAPPEIKEDDEEEEERNEEEGGLSKSGKELKKLLGRNAMNESDDDDDDDEDIDEDNLSPVLAPKKDAPKEEPVDNSPTKPAPSGSAKGTPPTSKSSKGKRKSNSNDVKSPNGAVSKKIKSENGQESKPPVKEEPKATASSSTTSPVATGPVAEEEIKAVIMARAPLTTQELVAHFKARLRSQAEKAPFAEILKRISKIQKSNGANYVVLRET